jgi:hypothetical protein
MAFARGKRSLAISDRSAISIRGNEERMEWFMGTFQ